MNFEIIHINETDSTNRWMKENGKGEMVVTTEFQTAGKGCGSNTWESEKGKNLLFSVLIHPHYILARNQFIITQIVSVALCETLKHYINTPIEIKWPNDIYIMDKKICGVLIENKLEGCYIKDCIIGIGLNVNQTKFISDAPNPVSIKQLTGKDMDRKDILATFLKELKTASNTKSIHQAYLNNLYRRNTKHLFSTMGRRFEATIVGVNDDGRLMLQDNQGTAHLFRFKEVQFIIND